MGTQPRVGCIDLYSREVVQHQPYYLLLLLPPLLLLFVSLLLLQIRTLTQAVQIQKKMFTLLDLCVSSLRRGHANLLCIVPILADDLFRGSTFQISKNIKLANLFCQKYLW